MRLYFDILPPSLNILKRLHWTEQVKGAEAKPIMERNPRTGKMEVALYKVGPKKGQPRMSAPIFGKRDWELLVIAACYNKLPDYNINGPVELRYTVIAPSLDDKHLPDGDNIAGACKEHILDFLRGRKIGFLADDAPKVVRRWVVEYEENPDKEEPSLIVEIVDYEGGR